MNGIGKRLKQERKRLRLTQSALGAIGGVEANAQGHYESGQRMPRADYLFRIAAAGVNINRVVTGTDAPVFEREHAPAMPTFHTLDTPLARKEAMSGPSMTRLIGQLRQSLWTTAAALCEVSRLARPVEEDRSMDEHLQVLQAEIDVLVALTLGRLPQGAAALEKR